MKINKRRQLRLQQVALNDPNRFAIKVSLERKESITIQDFCNEFKKDFLEMKAHFKILVRANYLLEKVDPQTKIVSYTLK